MFPIIEAHICPRSDYSDANGEISFDVRVANTGSVAGKDVVEIYYTPPYTNGGIEKSSVNLLDFAKTEVLEPNTFTTVHFEFNEEDMASFDTYGGAAMCLKQAPTTSLCGKTPMT